MPDFKSISALIVSYTLVLQLGIVAGRAESSIDVAEDLVAAEASINVAHQAVIDAQNAGANVSSLLIRLNEAGEFLARARMAYRLGNLDEASQLADSSKQIGVELRDMATQLRDTALSENLQRAMFTMTAFVVSIALIVSASLITWRLLTRKRPLSPT